MIEIDSSELEKAAKLLEGIPGAADKATKSAIAKSIRGARKDAADKAKERYTIRPMYITRTLKLHYATNGAVLECPGRSTIWHISSTHLKVYRKSGHQPGSTYIARL